MNRKNIAFAVIVSALLITIGCIAFGYAADTTPGSASDPVVTKAYVDRVISELRTELKGSGSAANGGASSAEWEVVFAEAGKTIIGGQGTEMILRSGKAVAVHDSINGLSDLTAAEEVMNGTDIGLNHLLLIPRADGRGIRCTEDAYVMVLGSYEIKSGQ